MSKAGHQQVNPTRRRVLGTLGLAAAAAGMPGLAGATVVTRTEGDKDKLALWYDKPARQWVEALPVGNGRLGAMVYGRPLQERLQLNEDTLWAGGPYRFDNPGFKAALPRVRALIDEGKFIEARDLVAKEMIAQPATQMPYGAAGDLLFDFHGVDGAQGFRRTLDLDSAIATTRFASGAVRHVREVFSSAPDQVIVLHLQATGGTLDFDVGYRHPREVKYGDGTFDVTKARHDVPAGAPWDVSEDLAEAQRPASLSIRADGPRALLVEGRNADHAGVKGALRYAVRVMALGDGKVDVDGDRLRVRGAREVTLLIGAATSFVSPRDIDGDPVKAVRERVDAAARKPYARLRADHVQAHRALFGRLSLRLGRADAGTAPTDARIAAVPQTDDASLATLAALYLQYGRYLLISSSRPGSQPANLQGIWNEGINPPWGSKYTININTEMNYWPAEAANLAPCVEPLVKMVEELAVTGAAVARESWGARGWVAHHNTDLWRAAAPIDGPNWGMWPCGGAWLCKTLWDHYEYNPDDAYLARIYPALKGAAMFFVDVLVEDPKGRGLVTSPSLSPENPHHPDVAVCAGPAMDRQIVRDLFASTLAAHAKLRDPDADFRKAVEAKRAHLAPDRIGAQGQLQEWLDDWDAQAPDQHHRHVSHLYAVYPSEQINVRDTPDLIAAAKVSLNTRGDMSTGWATAWRLALWARMGDGEHAYSILRGLLAPERTYPNMFDAHPPFQIDGNFGGAAGILEMLVQSWGGEIRILPALPRAWPEGAVHGIRARGGIEVDLDWTGGRATRVALRGKPGQAAKVRIGERLVTVKLDASGRARVALT
ncbi:glycoside hydrolase family 95 protein [Massilia orientalis]|uniref:Glycosyl hydrolase family 95 catalytic domain-containing protein n=1 Tax=Massilia orientalis TaxID=3050128 RepID=A0ACC7MDJ3_9BURK|nr:glycoside hydrolase family 95 protein [Massilia sp. YIM B02787]